MAESRSRLREFDALLPDFEDTPETLADMLRLAKQAGVSIPRGDYKSTADSFGNFARYQMTVPATGEPKGLVQFMRDAMLKHRTLTIESARFSRAQPDARSVEARLQWTLLTRLPRGAVPSSSSSTPSASGRPAQ